MTKGEKIYHDLCRARTLDAAVARLTRAELATVAEHLSGLHPSGGIPAQVWGMVSARMNEPETPARRLTRKS